MSGVDPDIPRLDALPRFATAGEPAYQPGFDRIETLLDALGNPHLACPVVHVAGTNGKGSTASFAAAIATAAGLRTGLHTSPHLRSVGERMRIDGKPAPVDWIADAVERLAPVIERIRPSYFEVTVALSFAWFVEERADLAVVEVGLGGRLDATNVVDPSVCVITEIGLDHQDILGPSVEAIAREKAGIMKHGVPVVAADSGPAVEQVLVEAAREAGCPLHLAREELQLSAGSGFTLRTPFRSYPAVPIGLPGEVQQRNAALAVRAIELLSEYDGMEALQWMDAFRAGVADVTCLSGLRGRMETLFTRPLVVADVAHNAEGLRSALETFQAMPATGRRYVLMGVMADKPVAEMVRSVVESGATIVPVRLPPGRALPAERLAGIVSEAGSTPGRVVEPGPEAVPEWIRTRLGPEDAALIAGSHLLVGPVLAAWT